MWSFLADKCLSNSDLVNYLVENSTLKTERIIDVFKTVDRADFCSNRPYTDCPQDIGYFQTISAPHMHAHSLELLNNHLKSGAKVLDVGCGSGILSAMMAILVGPAGRVIGIDIEPNLLEEAEGW
eukprot:TRINITY_DN7647_c0_g1_i6.p1 TRINITY_DN7647_c0_g1~~TRINITY_DN7647_c0_g1_i6.p1  ORF type:complete len:125 (-),score=21.78 TRINITY_DN7647_c0_g1_i6:597-971(-)